MKNSSFSIKFKRIIAVNSANFAYVEIPLDDNLVLLGTGNLGKSSIINATRFFLLPDVNVKNAAKKFGFIAGAGKGAEISYYDADQIYSHYLPNVHSRLILEVEHTLIDGSTRRHCQIISRADNYFMQRCFIPEPYDTISHLFWYKDEEAGKRPEVLPGRQLLHELKKINNKAKQLNQVEQIAMALYEVDVLAPDQSPYTIYPLAEVKAQTIESFRDLIKLLFNQDSRSLRSMTASAIEANDDNHVLDVNISEIISEHVLLKERKEHLQQLRAEQPNFLLLKKKHADIMQQDEAEKAVARILVNLTASKEAFNRDVAGLQVELEPVTNSITKIKKEIYDCEVVQQSAEKSAKRESKKATNVKEKLDKCEEMLKGEFRTMNSQQAIEAIQYNVDQKHADLGNYKNESIRQQNLARVKQEIVSVNQRLDKVKGKAAKHEFSIKNQLPIETWQKLNSVNTILAKANPGRELTDQERSAVENFTNLMLPFEGKLAFFDEHIDYLQDVVNENIAAEIESANQELRDLDKEQKKLHRIEGDNSINLAKRVQTLETEIKRDESDLDLLKSYSSFVAQYAEAQQAQLELEKEAQEAFIKGNSLKEQWETEKVKQKDLDDAIKLKMNLGKEIQSLFDEYNFLLDRFGAIKEIIPSLKHDHDKLEAKSVRLLLSEHRNTLEKALDAKSVVYLQLCEMINRGFIKDDHNLLQQQMSDEATRLTFEDISQQYALLEQNTELLKRDTQTHNDHVRNRLERLSKTSDKIQKTIRAINGELAETQINDLHAVKVTVVLNSHFEDLVETWRSFDDMNNMSTLDKDWYQRLQTFVDSDAVDKTDGRLKMDSIIQAVSYQTRKHGEPWDTKDQSNSTKMLINMHLCDIFIQQLADNSCNVAFPLILDEIGSVSSEQFSPLILALNEKGHFLIGATTHGKAAELIEPFKNYLIMDEMSTSYPYETKRVNVCYIPELEYIYAKEEQLELEA